MIFYIMWSKSCEGEILGETDDAELAHGAFECGFEVTAYSAQ